MSNIWLIPLTVISFVLLRLLLVRIFRPNNANRQIVGEHCSEEAARENIDHLIDQHINTLARKYRQKVSEDDYGNVLLESFLKEIDYFIENVINKDVTRAVRTGRVSELEYQVPTDQWIRNRIFEKIKSISKSPQDSLSQGPATTTGEEFELSCMELLKGNGWIVRHIGKSGDQGADLLAEKAGRKVAVQCKWHSKPVGNGAVQEAVSAQHFHETNEAAVVTNQSYTRAAKTLAKQTKICLLHYQDLSSL